MGIIAHFRKIADKRSTDAACNTERRMAATPTLTRGGYVIKTDPVHFGELRSSNEILHDREALCQRMDEDGYLLLRGLLDKRAVGAARLEIIEKLADVGEIDTDRPLWEAFASGVSRRDAVSRSAFEYSLRTGEALNTLCRQGKMIDFYEHLLGGQVYPPDYIWVRAMPSGRSTPPHIDWVFMNHGTRTLYTSWIPLGDVPRLHGSLMILEGSHKEVIHDKYADVDVDRDTQLEQPLRCGVLGRDPVEIQQHFGGRWLAGDFRLGDVLVFSTFTIHCSLDNQTSGSDSRIRLSCDTSYQLATDPLDERWIGPNPPRHNQAFIKDCVD